MAWAVPQFDKEAVNRAAKWYVADTVNNSIDIDLLTYDFAAFEQSLDAINNWRAIHAYPLNIMQMNLRRASARVDVHPLVAQRTKRLTSIVKKLIRRPQMKLTQMQDIGGCRSVVKSIVAVRDIDAYYRSKSRAKDIQVKRDDYIT